MASTKAQREERAQAAEQLREWVKPGDTLYTILRHTSSSGMTRAISIIRHDPVDGPHDVSYLAARAMGDKIDDRHGGIKIGGAGMNMGFALVYNLGRTLYPDGFGCIGDGDGSYAKPMPEQRPQQSRCPSNDHSNADRDYTPHSTRKPHMHSDGGYALRHRWL